MKPKLAWEMIVHEIAVKVRINVPECKAERFSSNHHGYILTQKGWQLSPAFDINPFPNGYGLSLNISENNNRLDTDIALTVAPYFRIDQTEGLLLIEK